MAGDERVKRAKTRAHEDVARKMKEDEEQREKKRKEEESKKEEEVAAPARSDGTACRSTDAGEHGARSDGTTRLVVRPPLRH